MKYLSLDEVMHLAGTPGLIPGGPIVRDLGLLGSAVARPQTTLLDQDAYPDLWSKTAALCDSISNTQPLLDGNKRLAWMCTVAFLAINGIDPFGVSTDNGEEFVMSFSQGQHLTIDDIAARLRALIAAGS